MVDTIEIPEERKFSKAQRKIKYFFSNITIEPVLFLFGILKTLDLITQGQLIIGK